MLAVDPYATKVLLPEVHAPIVANLPAYAADAGLAHDQLWTSMRSKPHTKAELDYIVSFRRQALAGKFGLFFYGTEPNRDVSEAMSLMAAALVRDYIRARVMPTEELFDYIDDHGMPEHTALFVPDFLTLGGRKGTTTKHRVGRLVGLLLHRRQSGLQTVIYAPSLEYVKLEYGSFIARHIETQYHRANVNPV